MDLVFPISFCPSCHHDEFKNKIGTRGVAEITYNNQGKAIHREIIRENYGGVRDTWFCGRCETIVFQTKDCRFV